MKSELAIVGQIWQYNNSEYYFVVSFDGKRKDVQTGQTRYWYTLLPIDKKSDSIPDIIEYDTWTKITKMSSFKRVS
jgi:hypothetical protein